MSMVLLYLAHTLPINILSHGPLSTLHVQLRTLYEFTFISVYCN
jgi:hypothetical protein